MSHETLPKPLQRDLTFSKQVDQESINVLTTAILSINRADAELKKISSIYGMEYKAEPIKIYIDSYGGYVYQILGLISVIGASKTPVHTIVTGCAMSCGFMLLINGHKRFGMKHSTVLYHPVSSQVKGQVQHMKEYLVEIKRLQKLLEIMTLEKTLIDKKTLKDVKKRKKDWFIPIKKALNLGIIDDII